MTQLVQIGQTAVQTSTLGLGTNKIGAENVTDETSIATVRAAIDHGMTLLDTAYAYGRGRSEELIGQAIKGFDRHTLTLATKAAHRPDAPGTFDNSPRFLRQAVDDALRRLQTDYLDVFYIHFPDDHTDKAAAVEALAELKQAGKLRAIGVSNFSLAQLKEANAAGQVDIVEDHYSLAYRAPEQTLWPYLQAHQISFVSYFPLAAGLLTGKYSHDPGGRLARFGDFSRLQRGLQVVAAIAAQHAATITQVVLAWYLANPGVTAVIPGARTAEQAIQNAAAQAVTLTAAEYGQIDAAF
ncbi:aldo/keto reductase [Lacticaseibacillus daqingensis]|uniref:aldo/keto reductase n=1 Tax=Lacticaseibacillus daqingensis TaxID=2486014 RepID=UPI000F794B8A|nr:aldo/keto reductase [Lacticaseibacillus daqingensis]